MYSSDSQENFDDDALSTIFESSFIMDKDSSSDEIKPKKMKSKINILNISNSIKSV